MKRLETIVGYTLRAVSVVLLVSILMLMTANVIDRFVNIAKLDWTDEIIELMLVWAVFLGSAEVWRLNQHFAVDIVPLMVDRTRFAKWYRVFIALGSLVFVAIFADRSFDLFERATDVSPYFSLPRKLWYGAMPFSGALMTLFSLCYLVTLVMTPAAEFQAKAHKSPDEELADKVSTAV